MVTRQISSLNMGNKFKRTPIGELPVEWEVSPLEEISTISGGGTPDRSNPNFWDGDIPWATPTDITALETSYIHSTKESITKDGLKNSSANLMPANSVLMTSRATLGFCAINTIPMATNQGFLNFVIKDGIDLKYFYYLLISKSKDFERLATGSTFLEISRSAIRKALVQVPLMKEQQSIGEILSSVDSALEKSSAVIEKIKQLKKGLMQQLLTRGIGHNKLKNSSIGKIPVEWEIRGLGRLCTNKPEYGANVSSLEYNKDLPRYVRITDVLEDGTLSISEPKSINRENALPYMLAKGDFLFARSGATVGKTYLYRESDGECAFAGYMIRFKPDKTKLLPEYLFQLTHSDYYYQWVKNMLRAGAQPNINGSEYSSFSVSVPIVEEQSKIVKILSSIDELIQCEEKYQKTYLGQKSTLMQLLLTGKIRILGGKYE